MDSILVTGGAGYIGSHIVEKLVKTNKKIIILDNLITGYKKLINKKAIFIKGDIKNYKKLLNIVKKYKINSIIHLAAYLNISEAEKNKKKYYLNNVKGTLNIIKCCDHESVKNIVFSSSCSIYGNVKGSVNEKKRARPNGYYAFTKLKGEQIIKEYSKKFNYNYAILRYFNIAGASSTKKIGEINSSHGHLFKNIAIQSLKKKPRINIYGNNYKTKDGTCIRDFIHVSDIAEIHGRVLEKINKLNKSKILNCGYGRGISVKQVAKEFRKYTNKNLKIIEMPRRKGDLVKIIALNKNLNKFIKWRPKFNNLKIMVKSSLKWEKNQ